MTWWGILATIWAAAVFLLAILVAPDLLLVGRCSCDRRLRTIGVYDVMCPQHGVVELQRQP